MLNRIINPITFIRNEDVSWYRFGRTNNNTWYLVVYTLTNEVRLYEESKLYGIKRDAEHYNCITKLDKNYRIDIDDITRCCEV